jgi:hypothetical protein
MGNRRRYRTVIVDDYLPRLLGFTEKSVYFSILFQPDAGSTTDQRFNFRIESNPVISQSQFL